MQVGELAVLSGRGAWTCAWNLETECFDIPPAVISGKKTSKRNLSLQNIPFRANVLFWAKTGVHARSTRYKEARLRTGRYEAYVLLYCSTSRSTIDSTQYDTTTIKNKNRLALVCMLIFSHDWIMSHTYSIQCAMQCIYI